MAFFFSGDEQYRELTGEDAYRAYLITRETEAAVAHSGAMRRKRFAVGARHIIRRVDDLALRSVIAIDAFLHRAIEALARSKMRRIQRELALRGVRYDRAHDNATPPRE